jgi:hypothetical protein
MMVNCKGYVTSDSILALLPCSVRALARAPDGHSVELQADAQQMRLQPTFRLPKQRGGLSRQTSQPSFQFVLRLQLVKFAPHLLGHGAVLPQVEHTLAVITTEAQLEEWSASAAVLD